MFLGQILAEARNAASALPPELRDEIERRGESPALFARIAVSDFERLASEEDWTTLVSAIRNSDDPGATCLDAMVRWRLDAPHCTRHAVATR